MTTRLLLTAAAVAAGSVASAQYVPYGYGYGGYGGYTTVNPYNGAIVQTGATFNPYTGGPSVVRNGYNPYTGTVGQTVTDYSPYTGTTTRYDQAYNPYTGLGAQYYQTYNPRWNAYTPAPAVGNAPTRWSYPSTVNYRAGGYRRW